MVDYHKISADFMEMFGVDRTTRGPMNELHVAAAAGSLRGVRELLSRGTIDIDSCNPDGASPLTLAAERGHTPVVKYLVDVGAYPYSVTHQGCTALHLACVNGHVDACKLLIGVRDLELEAATNDGYTFLHLCAMGNHTHVMKILIGAGEDTDSRLPDGRTPMHIAAMEGHVDALRILLRARANPLLTSRTTAVDTYVPLDTAVRHGHLEIVRELIRHFGLEGCAGASGGTEALRLAAQNNHVDILALLVEEGVEDIGTALLGAIAYGREVPVKILLQLKGRGGRNTKPYVDTRAMIGDGLPGTPLLVAIGFVRHQPLPRIVRMLIDAGADATSVVSTRAQEPRGTPLDFVTRFIREKKVDGQEATEEQLHKLEAIRRLLLTVEAVHATSWLWQEDVSSLAHRAEGKRRTETPSTPLRMMLPVLRIRATKCGLTPETAFRWVVGSVS